MTTTKKRLFPCQSHLAFKRRILRAGAHSAAAFEDYMDWAWNFSERLERAEAFTRSSGQRMHGSTSHNLRSEAMVLRSLQRLVDAEDDGAMRSMLRLVGRPSKAELNWSAEQRAGRV